MGDGIISDTAEHRPSAKEEVENLAKEVVEEGGERGERVRCGGFTARGGYGVLYHALFTGKRGATQGYSRETKLLLTRLSGHGISYRRFHHWKR